MTAAIKDEFAWLDARPKLTGLEKRAPIMRPGEQDGKDRVWWTDGEYVWFRRSKSNPATLERHEKFIAAGDYKHVETQGDVEIWELQTSSPFKRSKQIDIGSMDLYNLRRQAALAACRRDWQAFLDIMSYLKERIMQKHGAAAGRGEIEYAEQYTGVMLSIEQRNGPSAGEINQQVFALRQRKGEDRNRLITIGGG